MKALVFTALMGFRMYFRDRSSVFWGMLFPLLLMTLIGLAFGRIDTLTFTVGVVGQSASPAAQVVRTGLADVPAVRLVAERSLGDALASLRAGRRVLVVVLPQPGEAMDVYYDAARPQESQTALLVLERFVAEANLRVAGATPAVDVRAHSVTTRSARFIDFLLPGILALTLAQNGLMGVSWTVTSYRQRLVLKRVIATPVQPALFLGGLLVRYASVSLVQLAVITIVGMLAFGARLTGSLGLLALLAIGGTVVFTSMGIAISTLARTPESANVMGSVMNFPMMFLAGTFWPRDLMPEAIRPLIAYLPLSPLVDAMRAVGARGEGLGAYLPGLAYLAGWGALALAVAARRFRWE